MKAKIYHFDMNDRDLIFALAFNPDPDAVAQAWHAGKYELTYQGDVDDKLLDTEKLEAIFKETQETGIARSTSVGDVIELDEVFYVVATIGFKLLKL